MRRASTSVRSYLDSNWAGTRNSGTKYTDLWTFAELVDLELAQCHATGGVAAVNYALAYSDRIEHALARLGAEFSLQNTGDWTMFEAMLTALPPGQGHVMPDWALKQARDVSKVEHQQQAWLRGEVVTDDGVSGGGGNRRRRNPKAKAKTDAGGKGPGKGKPQGGAQGS